MYFFCLQVNGLITRGLITGAREGGGGGRAYKQKFTVWFM